LRQRVQQLLQAHEAPASVLERPLAAVAPADPGITGPEYPADPSVAAAGSPPESAGLRIAGRYQLLEAIGEGGMGTVWMAQQTDPVKRLVAVKLIKPGMDGKQVLARFEAERQALALMDHPNIARVLDAGAAPDGRPFFVMELVKGVPITRYCDAHRLTPRQRLELFVPVCQAIQHAHHKGIIHRDVKPSNVLVARYDERPVPKVIDFGVAKAAGADLTEQTLHTGFGAVVGTLEYMSPEQASLNQLDVDTRSDIYSLGVLLYELLAGSPPFTRKERERAGVLEMLRVVREQEPTRPSTRLSTAEGLPTLAANRGTEPRRLPALVRGELDWIVMKCLEKDRNRRYESASALARDVERYLHDEPVLAGPPSATYRLKKFLRRNRGRVLLTALVLLLALASVVGVFQVRHEAALAQAALEAQAHKRLELQLYHQTVSLAERERSAGNAGRAEQLLDGPHCPPHLRGWEWHYLKRLRYGGVAPIRHSSFLWCLAVSPDGSWLAVGGTDGIVRLWNVKVWDATPLEEDRGASHRPLIGHTARVSSVAFSPDSRRLASASSDGTVKVWSIAAGNLLVSLVHGKSARKVAFSPDGSILVSCGDPFLKVWDAATWQELPAPQGHGSGAASTAFSPDGQCLAMGSTDGTVRVWETATWRELLTLATPVGPRLSLAVSPDGTRLAAAFGHSFLSGDECEIRIWDLVSGQAVHTLHGHQGGVFDVAFNPDGKRLATTGSEDATIKIWDVTNGLEVLTLRGHQDAPCGIAFSPDGRFLYSAAADQTLRVWDATPLEEDRGASHRPLIGHTARVSSVAFDRDGRRLVSASLDHTVRVWDVATGRLLRTLDDHPGPVQCVVFSPHGYFLASVSSGRPPDETANEPLKIWDSRTWRRLHSRHVERGAFISAAFTSDGKCLATANGSTVVVWDTTAFRPSPVQYDSEAHLTSVAVSPNGRRVAAANLAGEVWIWPLDDTRPVTSVLSPPLPIALVNLHAALTARPVRRLRAHSTRVTGVGFSPREDLLATCGMDGATRLWNARTFQEVAALRSHASGVRCLAFSPDGSRLATGGNDATIRVWDVAARRELFVLRGHKDVVYAVTFSGDGRYIASGSLDQTVRTWDAEPLAEARRRTAGRSDE
jgi:WD40 repeat protein/serine/threonine protein kinase